VATEISRCLPKVGHFSLTFRYLEAKCHNMASESVPKTPSEICLPKPATVVTEPLRQHSNCSGKFDRQILPDRVFMYRDNSFKFLNSSFMATNECYFKVYTDPHTLSANSQSDLSRPIFSRVDQSSSSSFKTLYCVQWRIDSSEKWVNEIL
jgi:hypothetical protein